MTRQRLGRAIELRSKTGMTYKQIGEKICCRPCTVYKNLRRYDERGAVHVDMRKFNRF
jgi:transposase